MERADYEVLIVDFLASALEVEFRAGYKERAISAYQALLELNSFSMREVECIEDISDAFEEFWNSECPRLGEVVSYCEFADWYRLSGEGRAADMMDVLLGEYIGNIRNEKTTDKVAEGGEGGVLNVCKKWLAEEKIGVSIRPAKTFFDTEEKVTLSNVYKFSLLTTRRAWSC